MKKKDIFITNGAKQTQKIGEMLGKELRGGEVLCLSGELGSGKTTFAQGVLKELGAKGPWTSPTFLVMKHYKEENPKPKTQNPDKSQVSKSKITNIYHVDCYRIKSQDIIDLGWEEIIADKNNIVIVEWAERIRKIIPKRAVWFKFTHFENDRRKITAITNPKR